MAVGMLSCLCLLFVALVPGALSNYNYDRGQQWSGSGGYYRDESGRQRLGRQIEITSVIGTTDSPPTTPSSLDVDEDSNSDDEDDDDDTSVETSTETSGGLPPYGSEYPPYYGHHHHHRHGGCHHRRRNGHHRHGHNDDMGDHYEEMRRHHDEMTRRHQDDIMRRHYEDVARHMMARWRSRQGRHHHARLMRRQHRGRMGRRGGMAGRHGGMMGSRDGMSHQEDVLDDMPYMYPMQDRDYPPYMVAPWEDTNSQRWNPSNVPDVRRFMGSSDDAIQEDNERQGDGMEPMRYADDWARGRGRYGSPHGARDRDSAYDSMERSHMGRAMGYRRGMGRYN